MQVEVLEGRQLLATITVDTAADPPTAGATLSLREAIEVSDGTLAVSSLSTQAQARVNGDVGPTNTIDFKIPTSDPGYDATTGVWTIAVNSGLPTISTNAAIIDGYSQPGAAENTLAQGDNAVLKIAISGANTGNFVGLTIAQSGSQLRGLDIEHFKYNDGVQVTAGGDVQVAGCFIGTDPMGETAAPDGIGVEIDNSSNLIGGANLGDHNVISGNGYGVYVPDQNKNSLNVEPSGNSFENNYIGIDAAGVKAIPNNIGVEDFGSGETYGGTAAGLGNVISGNKAGGLATWGSVKIEGNDIGTDATGHVGIPNQGPNGPNQGAYPGILAATDWEGPPVLYTIITGNVVSANVVGGIEVAGNQYPQAVYTISDNLIGTDVTGTTALGNGGYGLYINTVANATIQGNVISANNVGLELKEYDTAAAQHDVIQGNWIGTDKMGQVALGNTTAGVALSNEVGDTIGGSGQGQGNVIADNGGAGIQVDGGQQDQITQNSIFGNAGSGIELTSQVNQSLAAPVLTFTPGTGSTGTLSGTITESPNQTYTVEIFSNPSAPTAGEEQGETFVQDVTVDTDASGNGTFSVTEPIGFYTATATDPSGNTSPFSNAGGSQALVASQTAVASSANPSTAGQTVTFTAVVSPGTFAGTPTGTVTFTIDGTSEPPVSLQVVNGKDQATFSISTLKAGTHTISAKYNGDSTFAANTVPTSLTQTVNAPKPPGNPQATSTTVVSSTTPSEVGQAVTFTATVAPTAATGTPTGSVVFTIDGVPEPPVALRMVNGRDQALFSLATLAAGTHTIGARYDGDSTFAASAVALPLTQTVLPPTTDADPPMVVSLKRYGIHMQPTVLVLTFSAALDPARAGDVHNYRIISPARRTFRIKSAVYNPIAHTVTLRPRKRIDLHHTYHVTVIGTGSGGVAGVADSLLDGARDGKAGSDYVTTLNWRNVVLTPAEAKRWLPKKPAIPSRAPGFRVPKA
jgi:hypothetical protein